MSKNVAQKLIESHLVEGEMTPDAPIELRIGWCHVWTAPFVQGLI